MYNISWNSKFPAHFTILRKIRAAKNIELACIFNKLSVLNEKFK